MRKIMVIATTFLLTIPAMAQQPGVGSSLEQQLDTMSAKVTGVVVTMHDTILQFNNANQTLNGQLASMTKDRDDQKTQLETVVKERDNLKKELEKTTLQLSKVINESNVIRKQSSAAPVENTQEPTK